MDKIYVYNFIWHQVHTRTKFYLAVQNSFQHESTYYYHSYEGYWWIFEITYFKYSLLREFQYFNDDLITVMSLVYLHAL